MSSKLEVLLAPAEFEALGNRVLNDTVCVVFDVLRATSSMVTALANGASAIFPVATIAEALALRKKSAEVLLAGEREGLRIGSELTGGVAFDVGNSPREFTKDLVNGLQIVMTTTNGTRALRACAGAKRVVVGSFLNLSATAKFVLQMNPAQLLIICSGTFEQAAYEDMLGAGALCELLWPQYPGSGVADSALICRQLYSAAKTDLIGAMATSRNGSRLLNRPELRDDVQFCAGTDLFDLVVIMDGGGRVVKQPVVS
jgi:2-phosphosulfolactate phosphatase